MAVKYNNRLRGRTAMVLPASCSHSVVATMGTCSHKIKVLDNPLGCVCVCVFFFLGGGGSGHK